MNLVWRTAEAVRQRLENCSTPLNYSLLAPILKQGALKMEEKWKRVIGIDLSKRTYEAYVIFIDVVTSFTRFNGKLDPGGQHRLLTRLKSGDLVVMEAGTATFNLVRYLKQKKGVEFAVLNPAKLHIVFDTVCKTDRENAKKLAMLGNKFELHELPLVSVPTKAEQSERACQHERLSCRN